MPSWWEGPPSAAWIFKEIRDALDYPDTPVAPETPSIPSASLTPSQKLDILEELLRINVERIDEQRGILHTRRHLAATPLFKGIPNFRETRIRMLRAETVEELFDIMDAVRPILL